MLHPDFVRFHVSALDDESNLGTSGPSNFNQQHHINNESNNSGQGQGLSTTSITSLLRRVFEDLPHSFVQALTECGSSFSHDGSNGVCYAAHYMRTHYYHNDGHYSCISLRFGRNHIDFGDFVHRGRGNSNGTTTTGNLLSSQHIKTYTKFPWQHYEELLDTARINRLSINDGKKKNGLMPRQFMKNHISLAALISQKQLMKTHDDNHVHGNIDDGDDATEPELCSSAVIMKWMQQQRRQHLHEISSNDCEYKAPVLLDLSYRGASENETPILLLDNRIKVRNSGVFLHAEEGNALAHQVNATVLISAIRAAAALELPVNMTAVMPLATLDPDASGRCDDMGKMKLVISLEYEPQSVCDLESFGTAATVSLIFNTNFPIWRHYHLRPPKKDGENNNNNYEPLEPLYKLVPMNSIASNANDDCNNCDMHDLMNLSEHNIVPYMLLLNHQNHAYRTEVQFFKQSDSILRVIN